jgi:PAS domain S-box-containing protein
MAENILKDESQSPFEAVLNNLDSAIYISDMESHEILFMNAHMKKLFKEEDLIGAICWKSLHEGLDGPCEFCTNDKLIDTDLNPTEPYIWEFYNQKLGKWYELHDQAIPWGDGRLVRMEKATDITDKKHTEKDLKENHDRLAIALKGSNSGIWDWNLQTNEVFFDETFFQMAGYELNEFVHSYESWKKRVHSDDLEEAEKKITSYIRDEIEEYVSEFRFKTKDNDWIWILGKGEISESDNNGKAVRFTGTNVDITDRKQAELAIKESHEVLEKKVAERTSELKEMNTALKVLLRKRDQDEKNIHKQIFSNVSSLIIPYLKKLAKTQMDYDQQTLLKIVEANVVEIISPISHRFASSSFGLTLTEIKVANLIKEGVKTKEIARILSLSPRTIDKYREKIRSKLFIQNKKVNLQAYLASMQ